MDPERRVEPVIGWRVWNLSEGQDGPVLRPAGSGTDEWPRRRPLEARCTVPRVLTGRRRRHQAPDVACRCGIHASDSLDIVARGWPAWPPAPVIGRVALWGSIVAHERGWRARFAYPDRLRLVCIGCAWIEPGPGVPSVVHAFRKRLYTLCEEHAEGSASRTGERARRPARIRARCRAGCSRPTRSTCCRPNLSRASTGVRPRPNRHRTSRRSG